jgi:hypothetical protein
MMQLQRLGADDPVVRAPAIGGEIRAAAHQPVTFFITRPPARIISPRPVTTLAPSRWSRAAPALIRRGPEKVAGEYAADGATASCAAPQRPQIGRLEGQLLLVLAKPRLDLGQRSAGAGAQHQLLRLVEGDAADPLERDLGSRRGWTASPTAAGPGASRPGWWSASAMRGGSIGRGRWTAALR